MDFFKHFFTIVLLIAICLPFSEAQSLSKEKTLLTLTNSENTERCSTDQYMKEYLLDPKIAAEYEALQIKVANELENMKGQAPCANPLIVPVAIHYNNPVTAANTTCLIDAALAQIEQMNLDFSGCNANAGLLCDWINAGCTNFGGTAGADAMPDDGACIQFCLADQNLPAGEDNIGGYAITVGDYDWPNVPGNTWDDYMNVFVSNSQGGGILGIAPLSGAANPNGNGVYVLASAFGAQTFGGCNSGTGIGTGAPFNGGATLTHEVGHYFGLDHTFSDNLVDTPPQNNPNYGCPTVNTATCTATGCQGGCDDYAGNFMDYVDDDCMFTFTQDQVDVMLATAANQNQWATNSVSCGPNYPPCTNQAGACAVTCATQVTSQYSGAEDVCYAQGSYTLPTSYAGLVVDNAQSATYAWSTGGYISSGGNQLNGATTNLTQPTGCAPVTQTLYLNVGCTDGSIDLNAGTLVLTVFPDPTQLATADIVTFTNGGCTGPTFTVAPGCAPYATVTQNGGPAFPVTSGSGTVNYDVTLNYPVDCCATQGAEILLTGTIGSTTLNNGSADQACQNGTQPAIWNIAFTVPTAQNATTVNPTGLGAIKEVCIDLTVQNTDVLNITFDSPDCAQYEWEEIWLGSAFQGGSNTGPISNLCFTAGTANGQFDGTFDGDDGTSGSFGTCDVNANQWVLYIADYNCYLNGGTGGTLNGATVTFCDGFQQGNGGLCDFTATASYDCGSCASVDLDILFDGFPGQTSWDITDANGVVVASSGGTYGTQPGNSTLSTSPACLPDGCYDLNFYDSINNGMCPFQSSALGVATFITPGTLVTPGSIVGTLSLIVTPGLCGNYTLTDPNGGVLASGGGGFGASETNNFCLVGGVAPRLNNNGASVTKTINDFVFEIKPSVTSNFITVNYANEVNGQLRVIDLSGKALKEVNLSNDKVLNSLRIDVSAYDAGVYFVQLVTNEGEIQTKKFLKQ